MGMDFVIGRRSFPSDSSFVLTEYTDIVSLRNGSSVTLPHGRRVLHSLFYGSTYAWKYTKILHVSQRLDISFK